MVGDEVKSKSGEVYLSRSVDFAFYVVCSDCLKPLETVTEEVIPKNPGMAYEIKVNPCRCWGDK